MPELSAEEITSELSRLDLAALCSGNDAHDAFFKLAEAAKDEENSEAARAGLQVLASVASMMLDGENWDQPYGPFFNFGVDRGPVPSDFTPRDREVLRWAAASIESVEISARAADMVWLESPSRRDDIAFAQLAVQKWAAAPVTEERWLSDGRDDFARAIAIARRLRLLGDLDSMRRALVEAVTVSTESWFIGQVGEFLFEHHLAEGKEAHVLGAVDRAIAEFAPDLRRLELLLTVKGLALRGLGRPEESVGAAEAQVEALLTEAERTDRGAMIRGSLLEEAYQKARRIPRRFRSNRIVEVLEALPAQIRKAGEDGIDEMTAHDAGGIDLTDSVHAVREAVRGKSVEDALAIATSFTPLASFAKDKADAERSLEGSIMTLVGTMTFSGDGRKLNSSLVENYYDLPAAVWERMHMLYDFRARAIVTGVVMPAMEVISTEHRIGLADLRYLVQHAAIVPPDVKELFSLGLSYGMRQEFAAALHILVPQIEALVRYHLRDAGVDTERIDMETSVSNETGLSTLMKSDEADEIFGEDLAWELRALLCGRIGPNLRNNVAHGLLGASASSGSHSVYLWWLAMRLVFIPYYNALRTEETAAAAEGEEAAEEPVVGGDDDSDPA